MQSNAIIGIYAITHRLSHMVYVGSSVNIRLRINTHRWELNSGRHRNPHLQRAWRKYGKDAFDFAILELLDSSGLLAEREQFHLEQHQPNVFNTGGVAASPRLGCKASIATLTKCRASKRTPKAYAALALVHEGNKGRKRSDETKRRQSEIITALLKAKPEIVANLA